MDSQAEKKTGNVHSSKAAIVFLLALAILENIFQDKCIKTGEIPGSVKGKNSKMNSIYQE